MPVLFDLTARQEMKFPTSIINITLFGLVAVKCVHCMLCTGSSSGLVGFCLSSNDALLCTSDNDFAVENDGLGFCVDPLNPPTPQDGLTFDIERGILTITTLLNRCRLNVVSQ